MTVSSETNRSGPYIGNGVTTMFDYEFRIVDKNHLTVIKTNSAGVETTLTIDANYIVSGVGDPNGGQIAITAAPVAGETITILRNVPFTQETDFENQGPLLAETVEQALDQAAMRDQQLSERLDRAMVIPASASAAQLDLLVAGVLLLADSLDNINAVASNEAHINTVAGDSDVINALAAAAGSINVVAGIADAVSLVAASNAEIAAVANNEANIETVAGDTGAINALAAVVGSINVVAGIAADVSTVADNVTDVRNFADVYQGAKAADPAVRNDGSSLHAGDLYFNTTINQMKFYAGAAWMMALPGVGDLLSTNNLSELANKATARTNLGLGTAAVRADTDFPRTDVVQALTAAQKALAKSNVFAAPTTRSFTAGTGTYAPAAGVTWFEVVLVGGGSGGGTWSGGLSTVGGSTTFGPSGNPTMLTAGGGAGSSNALGGAGGSASGGYRNIAGTPGSPGQVSVANALLGTAGGKGGNSFFCGGGTGAAGASGTNAATNSGSGGGGAATSGNVSVSHGFGGSSGGTVFAIFTSPAASYPYAVGTGGAGANNAGSLGGSGAAGRIDIIEHYD